MAEPPNTLPDELPERVLKRDMDSAAPLRPARDDYRMEMPVELWFGDLRIGVKRGSQTCEMFLLYANRLLSDFKSARTPAE